MLQVASYSCSYSYGILVCIYINMLAHLSDTVFVVVINYKGMIYIIEPLIHRKLPTLYHVPEKTHEPGICQSLNRLCPLNRRCPCKQPKLVHQTPGDDRKTFGLSSRSSEGRIWEFQLYWAFVQILSLLFDLHQ